MLQGLYIYGLCGYKNRKKNGISLINNKKRLDSEVLFLPKALDYKMSASVYNDIVTFWQAFVTDCPIPDQTNPYFCAKNNQ